MTRHVPHLLTRPGSGGVVPLSPEQQHHLFTVLRMPAGAPVTYTDGAGTFGAGRLNDTGIESEEETVLTKTRPDVTMAVVPLRDRHRNRFLVEKLAELGVARLVWIRGGYGQGKPPSKARQWADSALEQSRGAWRMEIVTGDLASLGQPIVACAPNGGAWPTEPPRVIAVGPEGGWHPSDLPADRIEVSLGARTLRTETAAIVSAGLALCGPGAHHDQ